MTYLLGWYICSGDDKRKTLDPTDPNKLDFGHNTGPQNDVPMDRHDYWLESYREAQQYARWIHDSLFKLATITFAFNAILFTGVSLIFEKGGQGQYAHLTWEVLISLSVLGILFNGGAFFAFLNAIKSWLNVHRLLKDAENIANQTALAGLNSPMLATQSILPKIDSVWGPVTGLTILFYGFLFSFWFFLLVHLGFDMTWNDLF